MILTVTNVEYLGDYTLLCSFSDGACKRVDLAPLLKYPMFKELEDKDLFVQFGLEDTIFWVNGADIAPEYLYENGIDESPTPYVVPESRVGVVAEDDGLYK